MRTVPKFETQNMDKSHASILRADVGMPLLLTDVPLEIITLYESINEFLRQAKISCRYQNSHMPRRWPPRVVKKLRKEISADIVRNRSPTKSEHNPTPKKWPDKATRRLKMITDSASFADVRLTAYKLAKDVLSDPHGCTKTAGVRLMSVRGEVFVPLWSCGFVVAAQDRFRDREIKWVTCSRGLPSATSYELQEIMLVHTFIEAAWWAPVPTRRPSADDSERLISLVVNECMPLFPIETITIFDKLTCIEQHYQHTQREHISIQCPCERLKEPTTSFLMQKVNRLRDFLLYEHKRLTKVLDILSRDPFEPSLTFRRMLAAVARRAKADLAVTGPNIPQRHQNRDNQNSPDKT
eukprot:Gregarina_sp_Poly_1__5590@NODE_294_length_9872_cov_66_125038_g254_i0_p3_GENE_NODE_294_length_9872_cov_66_125038_g254_i0NODE_294_length_9872_cov_66_125038_g254_i0_p3_ORF_typecomplete_len353_score33_78_NODE_294_length_9872_cov_66_125038_g254_i074968554